MCVCEIESKRKRERQRERECVSEFVCLCVYMCVKKKDCEGIVTNILHVFIHKQENVCELLNGRCRYNVCVCVYVIYKSLEGATK